MHVSRIGISSLVFSLLFVWLSTAAAQDDHARLQKLPNQELENQVFRADIEDLFVFLDAVIAASQKSSCEEMSIAVQSIPAEIKMRAARTIANIDELYISDEAILEVDVRSIQIAKVATSCPPLLLAHKNVATIAHSLEKHQNESAKASNSEKRSLDTR